jgi:hypothetical protein
MSQVSDLSDATEFIDIDSFDTLPLLLPSSPSEASVSTSSSTKPKRQRTSWVYKHMPEEDVEYRYYSRNGKEEWHCKYCSKTYTTNGGTSVIQGHLDKYHHITAQSKRQIQNQKRQLTIDDAMAQQVVSRRRLTSGGDSLDPNVLELLFTKVITTGNLPLCVVEKPEFRELLYYLNHDIDTWLPSSHTVFTTICPI